MRDAPSTGAAVYSRVLRSGRSEERDLRSLGRARTEVHSLHGRCWSLSASTEIDLKGHQRQT